MGGVIATVSQHVFSISYKNVNVLENFFNGVVAMENIQEVLKVSHKFGEVTSTLFVINTNLVNFGVGEIELVGFAILKCEFSFVVNCQSVGKESCNILSVVVSNSLLSKSCQISQILDAFVSGLGLG